MYQNYKSKSENLNLETKVKLIIRRDGETQLIEVTLRNENGSTAIINKRKLEASPHYSELLLLILKKELRKMNLKNGVKIQSIKDGKMKNTGLNKGFIITHLDKEPIFSKQLMSYLNSKKGGILVEGIYPNGLKGYFGFEFDQKLIKINFT